MNASKARDFFSAYYEGELSGGIKEAFERSLASDASLKQEYDDFCGTMKILEEPEVDVEVPFDLHDKIMARLDHQAWEAKQNTSVSLFSRFRLAFVGGLVAVALVAGVMSLTNRNSGENSMGGIGGGSMTKPVVELVDITSIDNAIEIQISGKEGANYTLKHVVDNAELGQLTIKGEKISRPVVNEDNTAQAFAVFDKTGNEKLLIVLPGKLQGKELKGEGSVMDLALAMADVFRTPMVVRANDRERQVNWDFKPTDDSKMLASQLKDWQLNLTIRDDGISILSSFETR